MTLLKFFHVLFVFLWIGTLLAISRILAFQKEESKELSRLLRWSYFSVELPGMLGTIIFGALLLLTKEIDWKSPWLHMKLTFAFILIICDLIVARGVIARSQPSSREGMRGGFVLLHYAVVLSLIGILVAIYIIK